jgi:hypothetical protein
MKTFTIVAGHPGAGKTTYIANLLRNGSQHEHLLAGTSFAALPHETPVGSRTVLNNGTTLTAVGDFQRNADLWLGGGDVFNRINSSTRTPHTHWTRMSLYEAIVKVTTLLPADEYIYDNFRCTARLIGQLQQRFAVKVVLLQTPIDECQRRRVLRAERRARKNGRCTHPLFTDLPSMSPEYYRSLGLECTTLTSLSEGDRQA